MIIDRFCLASDMDERRFRLSGGFTIGMPSRNNGVLPFGVFPKLGISQIDFSDITVFSGGAGSVKNLLLKVMVSKLISQELPKGMADRCLGEYLNFCCVVYRDFARRNEYEFTYISREQAQDYVNSNYASFDVNRNWSMLNFYGDKIREDTFFIIEEPESFLSLEELEEFAEYIYASAKGGKCQFLISSNSPIIRNIKHASLYDFDTQTYKTVKRYI